VNILNWPWSKTRRVNCKDGTCRDIYKNPDEAFPLFTRDLSTNITAQVEMLKELSIEVSADIQRLIAGFFYHIDEINRSLQLLFRTVYIMYGTNPCFLDEWMANQVEKIIAEEIKMRDSILKLRVRMEQGYRIKDAILEIQKEMIADMKTEISDEIQQILEKSKEWRGEAT